MNGSKMRLYKAIIKPISPFATKLSGDTLFGSLCWAIVYLTGEEKLNSLLKNYDESPFLIVSDAFVSGYLLKPTMPRILLGEIDDGKKKEYKKKIWLKIEDFKKGNFTNAKKSSEIGFIKDGFEVKNSINYRTFSTGEDFAPYIVENIVYLNNLDIYFLTNEETLVKEAFELLSQLGYGKDANIGKGRFKILSFEDVSNEWDFESNFFMSLSSFKLSKVDGEIYYDTFTKFPKTRGDLENPFKNPLLLAKTTATVKLNTKQKLKFIGGAIKGFINDEKIIHQGYAITLPIGVSK